MNPLLAILWKSLTRGVTSHWQGTGRQTVPHLPPWLNLALADYHLFSFLLKNGMMKIESYPFGDKSRKLPNFCTGEII